MRVRPRTRMITGVGAAAALLAVLTGCVGSPTGGSPSSDGGAGAPTSPVPYAGPRHPTPLSSPATDPDLLATTRLTGCSSVRHGWEASGTVLNPRAASVTAIVVVQFTDPQARVLSSASAAIDVAAGATGTWTAAGTFAAPHGTVCVIRAVADDSRP